MLDGSKQLLSWNMNMLCMVFESQKFTKLFNAQIRVKKEVYV